MEDPVRIFASTGSVKNILPPKACDSKCWTQTHHEHNSYMSLMHVIACKIPPYQIVYGLSSFKSQQNLTHTPHSLFIHSLILQVFIEYFLCIRHHFGQEMKETKSLVHMKLTWALAILSVVSDQVSFFMEHCRMGEGVGVESEKQSCWWIWEFSG